MAVNSNNKNNSANNSANNSSKVIVNVNTAPRRRAPRRPAPPPAGGGGGAVAQSTNIYVPHQSTSIPSYGNPPPVYFQSASTNRDEYLASASSAAASQAEVASLREAYAQASVPGSMPSEQGVSSMETGSSGAPSEPSHGVPPPVHPVIPPPAHPDTVLPTHSSAHAMSEGSEPIVSRTPSHDGMSEGSRVSGSHQMESSHIAQTHSSMTDPSLHEDPSSSRHSSSSSSALHTEDISSHDSGRFDNMSNSTHNYVPWDSYAGSHDISRESRVSDDHRYGPPLPSQEEAFAEYQRQQAELHHSETSTQPSTELSDSVGSRHTSHEVSSVLHQGETEGSGRASSTQPSTELSDSVGSRHTSHEPSTVLHEGETEGSGHHAPAEGSIEHVLSLNTREEARANMTHLAHHAAALGIPFDFRTRPTTLLKRIKAHMAGRSPSAVSGSEGSGGGVPREYMRHLQEGLSSSG